MAEINFESLNLEEEEELNFVVEEDINEQHDLNLCLVGRFVHDRPIRFNSMKACLAGVWRPVKGMTVKEATQGLYLFKFFHPLDVEEVLKVGPWTFDKFTLIIDRVKIGVALQDIPLFHVHFWVKIHDVPIGMMLETVGKGLANYIGEFVEYDKNNNKSFWRKYMRVKVRVDVRSPLKIEKKIKLNGAKGSVVKFKYEKLSLFCFVCGRLGHAENKCEVKYAMERDDGQRSWANEIKAEVRCPGGRVGSRWLHEEGRNMADMDAMSTVRGHIPPLRPAAARQSSSIQGSFLEAPAVSLISNRPILAITNDNTTTTQLTITPALNEGNQLNLDAMDTQFPGLQGLMIILSWNCRGLGGPSAIPNLKKLARGHKPDILFLSETLSHNRHIEFIRVMLGFDSCLAIDVEGRSGGLAVFWKDSSKCRVLNYTRNFINMLVEDEQWGEWRLTCYYGYPERSRRRDAWCIIGDFNDLLSQADKKGIHPHPNGLCMGFRQAVSDCDLTDIPIEGHPFTLIKSRGTPHVIEERLDRAMVSSSWLQLFPQVRLSNLLASHSDHTPILLQWLGGRENLEVVDRVTRCANKLQRWGKKKRIRFKEEIDECVRRMNELRGTQDEEGSMQYQELLERHATLLIQEGGYWKQRAKMHWLQEGDMNTRIFHMSATVRSKKKKVTKLIADNGIEAHTQEELCEVAKSYFDTLFKPRDGDHDPILNLIQPRVTDDDNCVLTAPITKVEIQQALFQMHPDKSPGPDGFNPDFYQRFWEECSDDIFSVVSTLLERGYFPTSLNETNICLIPKCDNLTSMRDLRPISLCNVLYKMISEVLANRLKCCLDKCVSQEQSAFVEGRSILDNALIATEVIHALKRKTKGRRGELALKIDISKAYDKVDWGFLRGVMTKMRFTDVWIRWVIMCVSSVNYSVLINSDRVGPILPECLTALIHQAVGRGDLHGVKICRGAPEAAKEDLSRILGVKLVLGTGIYLGLPSMVGRSKEIMIKSVLHTIPSYVADWSGDNIRVMHDPWLRGSANRWVPSPQPAGVYQLSVRDLLHENYKAWNIVKVRSLFSKDAAEKILETPLVSSVATNIMLWAIGMVFGKLKLRTRHVIYFGAYVEDVSRRVLDCWKGTWNVLSIVLCMMRTEDELHIFFSNESSDTVGRVAMLLWCIWHNRNDKLWNDNVQMPRQIGRHVFYAWNDWYSVHKLQSNNVSGTTTADLVRTSVGLRFRDNSGHFMAGMTQWQQTVISSVEGEA
ncbi:hypothetical protein TSUD_395250 [Trifolium subterraneum]|uniref:CCHC-type domain-containing protein n=1 Tax=Trifolium subterraneum TaxID=3900 RepID=A0A2Z6MXT2_TRISU|nr:hypothetical protein TSUD_395250 [Trifolium subterraneum]